MCITLHLSDAFSHCATMHTSAVVFSVYSVFGVEATLSVVQLPASSECSIQSLKQCSDKEEGAKWDLMGKVR